MARQQIKKFRRNSPVGKQTRNWLWGQHSVVETLQVGRWRVYELYVTTEKADLHADLIRSKVSDGVELNIVSNSKLEELCQTSEHQGIVARVSKYPYSSIEEMESLFQPQSDSVESARVQPILVIMDRIQDATQFATILRCCKEAAVCGVIIGEHCQSQVTTQISRACLGAVNHFPIFQIGDLSQAIGKAKEYGFSIVAYNPKSQLSLSDAPISTSVALLVGNDTQGLAPNLIALSDHQFGIPVLGKATSLPTMIATAILLYEIRS